MSRRESQKAFYHRLAPDYDRMVDAEGIGNSALFRALFLSNDRYGRGLDIGCGTGNWTRALVDVCTQVVAIDSSADMLEAARTKLGNATVEYREVDVFEFPDLGTFEIVFSTFWISHVPRALHPSFWSWVHRSLEPGGRVLFQDSISSGPGGGGDVRRLPSGEEFQIVKNRYDFAQLLEVMGEQDLHGTIEMSTDSVYLIRARKG